MYGMYRLVRDLRTAMNDDSDRTWPFERKVRAIEAAFANLEEQGVLDSKTDTSLWTNEYKFLFPLPADCKPGRVYAIHMEGDCSTDPPKSIMQWEIEAQGQTNYLALREAYYASHRLRISYQAPYQVPARFTTANAAISAAATSAPLNYVSDWNTPGFFQIWPATSTDHGETVYVGAKSASNVIALTNRAIEGAASAFAAGSTVGPAVDIPDAVKECVLLYAQAECWAMRQAASSRSQYLQNYANLELKVRRQYNDRVHKLRTRPMVLRQFNDPRRIQAGNTVPTTYRDYMRK